MTTNPYQNSLSRLYSDYADRRGWGRDMLFQATDLAEKAIEHAEKEAATQIAAAEARIEGRIEQAQTEADRQRDECEGARRHARSLQALLDEKRTLRDERQRDGEEVKVTIGRDHRGWQLGDLEEVAYRMRMGGAVDDTPIKVGEYSISGNVPDPNMVSLARLERPERESSVTEDEVEQLLLYGTHGTSRMGVAVVAVIALLLGVLLGAVVL